jgi:adenylate cyclase
MGEGSVPDTSLAARIRSIVTRYIRIGVEPGGGPRNRSREIVNFVSFATVLSNTGFAMVFSLIGFRNFLPVIAALLLFSLLWMVTPLLHRFGELAAGTYLWATALVGNALYASIAGADAGFQYFLLAGPAILVMALGSRRIARVTLYFVILLVVFAIIELTFPRKTDLVVMSEAMTRTMFLLSIFASASFNLIAALYTFRKAEDYQAAFEAEHERSERLLLNLVPLSIAERLKHRPNEIIADTLPAVTILFADIVGFTQRASGMPADRLVAFLNRIFLAFDRLADQHGLEKIKTIGDAYMVAGGMPEPSADHASAVADMALGMIAITREISLEIGEEVAVRVGIHSGPAIAGVIGETKLFYDVWGDTVNVAARMESHGESGRIQVSDAARQAIGENYAFVDRGLVRIKGKGEMAAFWLEGKA